MEIKNCNISHAHTVSLDSSAFDVANELKDKLCRSVFVLDDDKPVGIITATDLVVKVIASNKSAKEVLAKDIMSSPVVSFDENSKVTDAYFKMIEANVYSCAVTKDGKFVGVLSLQDALKRIAELKRK